MDDLKVIVANNLSLLRKKNNMTQFELAERLNYSDKSVSKWERGESIPDLEVLVALSKLYNVTLDALTKKNSLTRNEKLSFENKQIYTNKLIISLLAVLVVWTLATIVYVYDLSLNGKNSWTVFIWAFPISFIVAIVFNSIWGVRIHNFIYIALLLWTLLLACYLQFIHYNFWPLFILGVPAQIVVALWSRLKPNKREFHNCDPDPSLVTMQDVTPLSETPATNKKGDK